jgi:TolA-binding protein
MTVLETKSKLHKELSYLISLHENKMNKGKLHTRLDDLDNRVNELSHKIEQLQVVNRKELPFSEANIKPIESTQELFNTTLTPEPITSTTLKTPNEWLKLMSEEEIKQWEENRKLQNRTYINDAECTFYFFIATSITWERTPQGKPYWYNISHRYNN